MKITRVCKEAILDVEAYYIFGDGKTEMFTYALDRESFYAEGDTDEYWKKVWAAIEKDLPYGYRIERIMQSVIIGDTEYTYAIDKSYDGGELISERKVIG